MTRTRGFTLIELLVGVAIVSLLIGIALPALGGARERARTVQCVSNQRQLVLAWTGYAETWAGMPMPASVPASSSGVPVYWWGRPAPELGSIDYASAPIAPHLDAALSPASVLECPSQALGTYTPQPAGYEGVTSTYGYNGYAFTPALTGYAGLAGIERSRRWLRVDRVRYPSRQLVFGDAMIALGGELRNVFLLDPPELFTPRGWRENLSPTTSFRHGVSGPGSGSAGADLVGRRAVVASMDASVIPDTNDPKLRTNMNFGLGSVGPLDSLRYIQDAARWR